MPKSNNILFTGITGLLGKYFLRNKDSEYDITGIANKSLQDENNNFFKIDITDKDLLINFVKKTTPQIIVHAASIGNVDYCESHPEVAHKVNIEGTKNIISAAKEVGAKVIFTSSNAVYDGINHPFGEESKVNPVDVYGQTKVEGENLLRKSNLNYTILRLMTMYGWPNAGGRANPATWVIDKLTKNEPINVVNDIYNNHLWAGQAADAIWKVIKKSTEADTYNVAGKDCISRYELALKVAEVFNLDSSLISPVDSSFFKNIVARPKNTCFNTEKIENILGVKPLTIDESLKLMRKEQND